MPNFKPVAFAAAATVALTCAPVRPAAAAGPLLLAAPWALGHVIAGLARLAAVASVASAAASPYSREPYAGSYGYGYGYDGEAAAPAYYPPSGVYPGYVAQPRYYPPPRDYPQRAYYPSYGYAAPRHVAAPPAYYSPAARYYPSRSYYRPAPWYARPARGGYEYQWQRSYRGAAMRYSGAYGSPSSYRTRGYYLRR